MADDFVPREESVEDLTRAVADRVLERMTKIDEERVLLDAVIENIPAGLAVVDQQGVPLLVNSEALRIFATADVKGFADWHKTEAYRLDGSRVGPEERPIARTLATGEVVRGEMYELVIQGRHVIFEISTAPIQALSGDRSGGIAVFRDVTVREQTERAERDFVTNAAHELQSPLAAIVSAIEVLQAGAKDGPQRDVFLGHIERESDRLARLVRALLVLARTQIGLEAPRDELVAMCPMLQDIGDTLRLFTGVDLDVECPKSLAVVTNRELVEQAVVNLAENAAKNTKSGHIRLSARERDDMIEIEVSDTGSGIAASERTKVFERFFRADQNGEAGFGLGLAIVRAVANALEGELELDSTVGAGTVVRLRLPGAGTMVAR